MTERTKDEIDRLRAELASCYEAKNNVIRDGLRVSLQLARAESALATCERERDVLRRDANARFETAKRDGLTIRKACRMREPLGGASAQCLEHALTQVEEERDAARAKVRRLVKALRTMQGAADRYVRWIRGPGGVSSGSSSFDELARAARESETVLAGYEVDDG